MTSESLLLIGRETRNATEILRTHADRLGRRTLVDEVAVATYETEPVPELRDQFEQIDAETVFAVPMCAAHTHETLADVPAALSSVSGTVHYCEPIGRNPAVTEVIADRGTDRLAAGDDTSLILVGFGSSSKPYQRQMTDYHATRLREQSDYGEVLTCYLLQNPAVECVRYNAANSQSVAVPLFLARSEATERRIPEELELSRSGIEYADPFGTHPRITDAIESAVEQQRALASDDSSPEATLEGRLAQSQQPLATDGNGVRQE